MKASHALRTLSAGLALFVVGPALAQGGTISGKVEVTPAKYAEETVVYLKGVPGSWPASKHNMDQKGLKFAPHVLAVKKGDTVDFLNHDGVAHNVYSPDNEGFNLGTFKQNEQRDYKFDQAGQYTLLCSIHPEMLGYVFVAASPYAAAVDKSGRYTLKDVPPGTYKLAVWNSHLKAPDRSVTVAAGRTVQENVTVKR